jgi:hypothetical protein
MAKLNIHLQEGFDHDTVIVRVGGREIFRSPNVTTRTQIGLAEMLNADVSGDLVDVDVDVPARSQHASFSVSPSATPYLGVSLDRSGQLIHHVSAEIMGYV